MTAPVATNPAPALPEVFGLLPRFPAKMRDWTPAHRSRAAKRGWSHRKDDRLRPPVGSTRCSPRRIQDSSASTIAT